MSRKFAVSYHGRRGPVKATFDTQEEAESYAREKVRLLDVTCIVWQAIVKLERSTPPIERTVLTEILG